MTDRPRAAPTPADEPLPRITARGTALVVSDAVHHFVVLWLVEGDPQFHLWY